MKAKEFTNGQTCDDLKETGKTTKWTGEGCSHGLMVVNTKENISMIKSQVLESLFGQMAEGMKGTGKKGNSTELGRTSAQRTKCEKESGIMENG